MGGAGITSPVVVCAAAVVSSWLAACSLSPAGLPWVAPAAMDKCIEHLATFAPALGGPLLSTAHGQSDPVPAFRRHSLSSQWTDQSLWSEELYKVRSMAFDAGASERFLGLRRAQTSAGVGLWLTATPAAGPSFSSVEWQLLLRFRCGAPCFTSSPSCSGCGSRMDDLGDHALCCAHNGLYRRHNHVRDALFQLCSAAGWAPAIEQQLPGSLCRPADVLLRAHTVRPVAVDVTVSHPLRQSASSAVRAGTVSAAAEAEQRKIAASKAACLAVGWDFIPFGYDAVGGLGPAARSLCRKLARQLAMQCGAPLPCRWGST